MVRLSHRFAVLLLASTVRLVEAQAPAGLAASALADTSFTWVERSIPGFRVYFLTDSYPAQHQDSLLAQLPSAVRHADEMIQVKPLARPIDLFFIENRPQMTRLIGGRATGFAEPSTRTVILVTNPEWRAFERHEIMHVVSGQAWGPPADGNTWLQEGLAQAADGQCAGYSNAEVAVALATKHGWIPLEVMLTRFRQQSDLRAYLQAAAFVDYLLRQYGPGPLRELWRRGAAVDSRVKGKSLTEIEREWKTGLRVVRVLTPEVLAAVESKGCG